MLTPATDNKANISELQTFLREISFHDSDIPTITVDGIFGSETKNAVIAFQIKQNLTPTGAVDYTTWILIYDVYQNITQMNATPVPIRVLPSASSTIKPNDSGNTVYILQAMLNEINGGYPNIPSVNITGNYDNQTVTSVKAFQALAGLSPTGIVDKQTWDSLALTYNNLQLGK